MTITGAGAVDTIIDGGGLDRVFHVLRGMVYISGVTVQSGNTTDSGGGIWNNGTLALSRGTVSSNTSTSKGGGIYNSGTLTLVNSTISSNTMSGTEIENLGGGIYSSDALTLIDSTVNSNSAAGHGGGIYQFGGTLTMTNSTVSENSSDGWYGGIMNHAGTAVLTNSTVSGNGARSNAGGITNSSGTTTLINSTVNGNTGGIWNERGPVQLVNTIIAKNSRFDCGGSPYTSLGHNLIGDDSGCSFTPAAGDLFSIDPLLGPLQNNGGPTFTHALLPGSPAIDAGDEAYCPDTDQLGVTRPQGGACDIGAFEIVRVD